jgi:hypothetical protein
MRPVSQKTRYLEIGLRLLTNLSSLTALILTLHHLIRMTPRRTRKIKLSRLKWRDPLRIAHATKLEPFLLETPLRNLS